MKALNQGNLQVRRIDIKVDLRSVDLFLRIFWVALLAMLRYKTSIGRLSNVSFFGQEEALKIRVYVYSLITVPTYLNAHVAPALGNLDENVQLLLLLLGSSCKGSSEQHGDEHPQCLKEYV